ncbi:transmembrane amino acid transporter protein-domain-containing protein [Rhodocollybia butyracea]|uniref:Transmembrane amino acid transporter protein-domain-containing protein n=1 Tax=Rhodocollybia butyracea TaxID=206335 RepID=A0A9P5TWS7_9AGAR|nr:transmembrane amino acid transporter protein-domain-containing protein [Rhodocollybia butyracea]
MFSSNRTRDIDIESGEASRPLLGDHNVVFSPARAEHSVRFQEDVQVIHPPLRSTVASREAEFELDDDEIDEEQGPHLPLIVGLLESSHQTSVPLHDGGADDIDLEAIAAKRTAGGGMFDSVANMANSILGAGLRMLLARPAFFTGLVLLVALCGVTDWTIRLIVLNAKLSGRHTYIDIMNHCFGSSGRAAVSFFQFSFAFGGMIAFGIIIGDTIPHVIGSIFPDLYKTPFVIFLCTTCVSYPLSLYRDIHKLSRASGLALISMLIIVISVLVEGPHVPPTLKGDPSLRFSFVNSGIFQAIGVISFAFVCHHNSLLIYGSLRTPTLDRFTQVTHVSTLISLFACATLAISGYLVFTEKTQGNILNNFPSVSGFIVLVSQGEVIEDYFFSHESFNPQRHLFFTTTILFTSMSLAMITCDLGVMLEITGGVSATALAFIFPAACYLKLSNQSLPWYSRSRLPAFICVAFGVIVLTLSLFIALAKSWTKEGEAKMCM